MHKILLLTLTLLVSCGDTTQTLTAPASLSSKEISFDSAIWNHKALIITTDNVGEYCSAQYKSGATFTISCDKTELKPGDVIYVSAPQGAFKVNGKDTQGLNNAQVVMM